MARLRYFATIQYTSIHGKAPQPLPLPWRAVPSPSLVLRPAYFSPPLLLAHYWLPKCLHNHTSTSSRQSNTLAQCSSLLTYYRLPDKHTRLSRSPPNNTVRRCILDKSARLFSDQLTNIILRYLFSNQLTNIILRCLFSNQLTNIILRCLLRFLPPSIWRLTQRHRAQRRVPRRTRRYPLMMSSQYLDIHIITIIRIQRQALIALVRLNFLDCRQQPTTGIGASLPQTGCTLPPHRTSIS